MIIVDTNLLSETLKPLPAIRVVEWFTAQQQSEVFTTAISAAELLYGMEVLPEGKRRTQLAMAIDQILTKEFAGRVLYFDERAARAYSTILAKRQALGRPISQSDAMIAAIARSENAALATRNFVDFEHCGITTINPWRD